MLPPPPPPPGNADDYDGVTWATANNDYITVNPTTGVVTIVAIGGPVNLTATAGSITATVAVTVGDGLRTMAIYSQSGADTTITEWPEPRAEDGRFVIANTATGGGIVTGGVTNGTFVTLAPPLSLDDGDIRMTARVRIAEYHDPSRGNSRGLFMGFFNDPAGMGSNPVAADRMEENALSAFRLGTDGSVSMVATRLTDNTVAAGQLTPAMNTAANPVGMEYLLTILRREDRSSTFTVRNAQGIEIASGTRTAANDQSMDIDSLHVGFAVFTSTVELSQITIEQGSEAANEWETLFLTPVTTPVLSNPTSVTVTGPTTVQVNNESDPFTALVEPFGVPQEVTWSVGLNDDGTPADISAFATWDPATRTLTGVAYGFVYVTATAGTSVADTLQVEIVGFIPAHQFNHMPRGTPSSVTATNPNPRPHVDAQGRLIVSGIGSVNAAYGNIVWLAQPVQTGTAAARDFRAEIDIDVDASTIAAGGTNSGIGIVLLNSNPANLTTAQWNGHFTMVRSAFGEPTWTTPEPINGDGTIRRGWWNGTVATMQNNSQINPLLTNFAPATGTVTIALGSVDGGNTNVRANHMHTLPDGGWQQQDSGADRAGAPIADHIYIGIYVGANNTATHSVAVISGFRIWIDGSPVNVLLNLTDGDITTVTP